MSIENWVIPKPQSKHMSKISEVKTLFRHINDGLIKLDTMETQDRRITIESLRRINEEMCDLVVELVKLKEKYAANN